MKNDRIFAEEDFRIYELHVRVYDYTSSSSSSSRSTTTTFGSRTAGRYKIQPGDAEAGKKKHRKRQLHSRFRTRARKILPTIEEYVRAMAIEFPATTSRLCNGLQRARVCGCMSIVNEVLRILRENCIAWRLSSLFFRLRNSLAVLCALGEWIFSWIFFFVILW